MQLDAATLAKVQQKNLANILKKLERGGTLTAQEQAVLAGGTGESGYCQNLDELAAELGVDRRTLANAKRRFAKDFGARNLTRADGRYHIAGWRQFLDANGVIGRVKGGDPDLEDERALRIRGMRVDIERKEHELQKSRELTLAVPQFEAALGIMVGNFNAALNSLPGRAAPKILPRVRAAVLRGLRARLTPSVYTKVNAALSGEGIIDFADVEEVLRGEVDIAKRTLSECEYLKSEVDDDDCLN